MRRGRSPSGRAGCGSWLAQPANSISLARNTLTQKIWDTNGTVDVKLDISRMADDQRAGFAFHERAGVWLGWRATKPMACARWSG